MADKRKLSKKSSERDAGYRALQNAILNSDLNRDPLVAIDRQFRTPIYTHTFVDNPSQFAQVDPDSDSPSLSRISISPQLQTAKSIEEYLTKIKPVIDHEKVHVLQNVESLPFDKAHYTVGDKLQGRDKLIYNLMGTLGQDEMQAYLLSKTFGHNKIFRKNLEMDNPAFNNPPTLFDKYELGPPTIRNSNVENIRQLMLDSLPKGLSNIINSWVK